MDGWLLFTRVILSLEKAEVFSIDTDSLGQLDVQFQSLSPPEHMMMFRRAAVARKLKFLEGVFGVTFSVADSIPPYGLSVVEQVFRGVTEGEFTMRGEWVVFEKIPTADIVLSQPPFDGIGPFGRVIGHRINLFGRTLDVGPIKVSLTYGELSDPNVVELVNKRSVQSLNARLSVLDNRITFRFERYASLPQHKRTKRLNDFKRKLAQEEPTELVELVDRTLQNPVSADEAGRIAVGWQYYNNLPDRYCPQEPELEEGGAHWRVPIYLVYTTGEGGPVGELVIHAVTGEVIQHTPIDELRSHGLALAEKILQAR